MKKLSGIILALIALAVLYLLLWPVPIAPKAWEAPKDEGYVGVFSPNMALADLIEIPLPDDMHGPEDIAAWDGQLYVSTQKGWILKLDPTTNQFSKFAETGGKPLGLEVAGDKLIVADAYKGLLSIDKEGGVELLTVEVGGSPILYADDLDLTTDGLIYFSDASTKFGAEAAGSTLGASLLEIMEHGETGRVLAYNPGDKTTRLVADQFAFSNGVATAPNGTSVWVVETGKYWVVEIDPQGRRRVIINNLPGFPDNINRGPDGTYFVGLVSKRAEALDTLSAKPFLRKLIWRLPDFMKPAAQDYGFILQLDSEGRVLRTWQDPSGAYPATTGAIVAGDRLYVSSLTSKTLGYLPYP